MLSQEPAQGRVERHDPMLDEPQDHVRRKVTGQIVPHQQHAQRWQRAGSVIGWLSPCCQTCHRAVWVAPSPAVGGGKVPKIAAHCSFSQGCKTALVALVTPLTRTAPSRG